MKKKYSSITCRYMLPVVASSIKIISLFSFSYNWLFVVFFKKSVMFSAQNGVKERRPCILFPPGHGRGGGEEGGRRGGGRSRTK